MTADDKRAVLDQALDAAATILNDSGDIILATLAPLLVPDLQPQALAAANTITEEYSRAEVLAGLAPRLSPALLSQALKAATAITDDHSRAVALIGLAPHLPANEQPAIVAQALNAAAITDESFRARRLVQLAPLLSPPLLPRELDAATAITDDFSRGEALTGLAPFLSADLLHQALAAIPKTSPEAFIAVLERCRSVLSSAGDAIYVNLLRDSLTGTERRVCLAIITAVAPALSEIGGVRAIKECISAISDVNRWWR